MNHVSHIAKNKKYLTKRSAIIKEIRSFFDQEQFVEIDAPTLLQLPGQEPYLSPMGVEIHNEKGESFRGYLHTSPEYVMKKALAAGFEKIYALGKCYRDYESFGGTHNPEFTMIEWYRADQDMYAIMDDCEKLYAHLENTLPFSIASFGEWKRISMKELWQETIHVNLDACLDKESMFTLCTEKGYTPSRDESYEDLFFRIFLNEIEPTFVKDSSPTIVYNYPAQMAALATIDANDSRYANRFEVYINGIEIANAFNELTDPHEQKSRLEEEQQRREALQKDVYDIDKEFIEALHTMPPSAGIALGVDRLVQVCLGCQNIDDVLVLPASKLFRI